MLKITLKLCPCEQKQSGLVTTTSERAVSHQSDGGGAADTPVHRLNTTLCQLTAWTDKKTHRKLYEPTAFSDKTQSLSLRNNGTNTERLCRATADKR